MLLKHVLGKIGSGPMHKHLHMHKFRTWSEDWKLDARFGQQFISFRGQETGTFDEELASTH